MSVQSTSRRLLHSTSPSWNVLLGTILAIVLVASFAARFYAIEPFRIVGNSMEPELPSGELVWVCKLPTCTDKLSRGDIVLVSFPDHSEALRTVFGLPGDTVHLSPAGKIRVEQDLYSWEEESEILAPRSFYVPRKNDSIVFKNLNDISFDYTSEWAHRKFGFRNFYTEAKLYRGTDTLPISRVGSTHIFGRPVSIREINGFHWQEYILLGLQIDREDPGAKPVHFERKLYRTQDSSEVQYFKAPQDAYYVICQKGVRCEDSRSFGYISKSQIKGKLLRF